ncbi:ABC transporter ATP-binding protein [Ketobacter sp. MCCC 1A13808]|uniref:ABC transporter ATP-binding protein n=1 Tax=Ketobacter sp. MCCC 1A13808 TaxID=2602738 RepID=UPI0012EC1EBC|nr:ATP-binding cassette domain-containing protein [Ketobacter sp. MCCC 1A13808]MVF13780.1 ABC transporter ATP-binding protein [Ketobacter sp. MCCC 1A13808]|tara:strand:- start:69 stop:779 length:711 start_codon:yes stop_codon:yes gene_type:complete
MSKNQQPYVRFQNVGVKYTVRKSTFSRQSFWPIVDINFELFRGETLGIVGRNGAGKSTILKLIAGIIEADVGCIENHATSSLLLSIQVGFKHQLTGRDNIIQSGLLLGMTLPEIELATKGIVDMAELGEHIDFPISTYSTGMRARLGFAVAVHAKPDILLIDEVLGVGDAQFREKSSAFLKRRIASNETVVLVSHENTTMATLCDRILWIENGRTKMIGEADHVLRAYNTPEGLAV